MNDMPPESANLPQGRRGDEPGNAGVPAKTKRRKKGTSPTKRTLAEMRKRGYVAEVTERWNPFARVLKDLFGFIDVLCLGDGEVVGVQTTSADNMAARIDKIANHENVAAVRKAGIRIVVHGWRKNAAGRWVLREVDCS